jgi:RND superfamily putative drug exporter
LFKGLANFVAKRHKLIIIFWLALLVISLPATQLVADVVVYEETSMAPEDTETARANALIADQFPMGIANSTALVVVQSDDVLSPGLRDFCLQLEEEVRDGDVDYLESFTSIYSIARDYLLGTVPVVYPLVNETEGKVGLSASLIFGGPVFYASSWGNNPVNETIYNASWDAYSMFVTNSSYIPLLENYSLAFWQTWVETFNSSNVPVYLDPLVYNEFERADEVVNMVAPSSLGLVPPEDEMDLFMTGVLTSFSVFTWNDTVAIHGYSVALAGSYLGVQNLTFLQEVLDMGPAPGPQVIFAFSEQIISSATLDSYHVAVPETVKSNLVNEETGIMIINIGFARPSSFRESDGTQPILENVRTIGNSIDGLKESLLLDQETILVTGDSALEANLEEKAWEDISRIDIITIALVFILIGIFFLSIVAPMVPVGGIGIAVVISQGMIFLVGSYVGNVHFSVLTLTLTAMLGAGTDYAIFLMARYREERLRGKSKEDSVRESVTWAGESVTTSGVAVMISFGALSLGSFSFVRTMGLSIMLGIGLALVVAITLIPSLLMLLGDRVFWPGGKKWNKNPGTEKKGPGYFRKASTFSVKHSKAIVLAALLVSVPAAYGVLTLETSFDFVAAMPETEATRGLDLLGEGFGKGKILPTYVVVQFESPFYDNGTFDLSVLNSIENLSVSLEGLDNARAVTGPTRPQGQTIDYGNLSQMDPSQASAMIVMMLQSVGEDNGTALLTIELEEEPFSRASVHSISEIHDSISDSRGSDPNLERAEILVGGATASTQELANIFNEDFQFMAVVVVLGIFVLLLFVLGSVLLPLRLILTILLSITWTLAVTMVLFQVLIGIPVLWMMPLILFVIAMGLGMDYDIFLTTRIREEVAKGKTDKEAIVEAVEKTGGIITAAGAVMAGAFGSMMLSSLGMLQEFGFALFFVIIIDAMIVRIYLVPAIMVLLEKWNWWAPGRIQRVRREEKMKSEKKSR